MSEINKIVYGNNTLIDLTSDTVNSNNLLSGITAHAANGNSIIGNLNCSIKTGQTRGLYNVTEQHTIDLGLKPLFIILVTSTRRSGIIGPSGDDDRIGYRQQCIYNFFSDDSNVILSSIVDTGSCSKVALPNTVGSVINEVGNTYFKFTTRSNTIYCEWVAVGTIGPYPREYLLIPRHTSASSQISCSSVQGSYYSYQAFNDDVGTFWIANNSETTGSWIEYDFYSPKVANKIQLRAATNRPSIADLLGSNDGANWNTLLSGKICPSATDIEVNLNNTTPYKYYRITALKTGNANPGFGMIQLIGYDA